MRHIKIQLLKYLDASVGRLLVSMLPARRGCRPNGIDKVLIVRPGGIGDAVLLLPAISAIKAAYPSVIIDVLAEKRNGAVFALSSGVNQVFHYDRLSELISAVRGNYDAVIDTEQWHRLSAVVARLTRAPLTIGYATNGRKRLFLESVPYEERRYEAISFFDLMAPLGIQRPAAVTDSYIEVPMDAKARAEKLLSSAESDRFVTLFTGASIPERRWGGGPFRELTERLHAEGVRVVVVGGPADQHEAGQIVAGGLGLNLAGKTTLPETAAVIERSALLVSGDSGILHIGVGLGIPTVSLFGPGIAEKWAPRGDNHIVINKGLPCSPCTKFGYTPKCPIDAQCLADISVNEIFDAAMQLLGKYQNQKDL